MALFKEIGKFFFGSPEKHKRVSTLTKDQESLLNQLLSAMQGQGAGGGFGSAADYFYNILNDNPELMDQFFAPEMRRFQQETIPGLAEQFAGMGSGALSSSGFRNAAVNAGTDLQERLGAIRAGLKQQAASGLMGLGQAGLGNYTQDVMTRAGSPGLFGSIGPGLGAGVGQLGADFLSGQARNAFSQKGTTSPYGGSLRRGY